MLAKRNRMFTIVTALPALTRAETRVTSSPVTTAAMARACAAHTSIEPCYETTCTTGCIEEAFAKEFHKRGLRVLAMSRRVDSMPTLTVLGIETLPLDVADMDSIREAQATYASAA
ncbi:hypothetical protein EW146_g4387 [Bondarzewia mesenterica]|uniref:Uncharacterized protein n=1 Tax=Bondarzewia mesenterica TaxID=1095465 RepID=A0A4S4LUR3_9AGAM|nr:hypothetical protein EW146_g4387 [Bondarzewia mesenterica]